MGGEVDVTDQRTLFFRPRIDAVRDLSAVERIGDQPKTTGTIGTGHVFPGGWDFGLSLGGLEQLERAQQVRMPGLRARSVLEKLLGWGDYLGKRHGSEAVEQCQARVEREAAGTAAGSIPLAGIPAGPLKCSSVARRGAAPWPSITVTVRCLAS